MLKFFFLQWAFVVVLATLPSNSNQRYHTEGSPDQTEARLGKRERASLCRGSAASAAVRRRTQKPSVLTPSFLGVPPDALLDEVNEGPSAGDSKLQRGSREGEAAKHEPLQAATRFLSAPQRQSLRGPLFSRRMPHDSRGVPPALQNQETTAASDRELLAELGEGDGGPPARAPTEAPGAGTTTRQPVEGFEAPSFDVAGGAPEEETQKNRQSKLTSFAAPTLADAGQPPAGAARAEGEPAFAPPGFAVAEPTELANTEERGEGTQFQPPAFGVAKPTNLQQQQQEEAKEVEAQEAAETENFAAPVFGASAPGFEGLGGGAYTPEGRTPRGGIIINVVTPPPRNPPLQPEALAAATTRETPPPIAGPSVGPENPHAAVSGSAEAEAREREERLRKRELELQRQQEQLQQQQQQLLQQQQLQQPQPAIPYPQQQQQQAQQQLEPVLSALQRLDQRIAELHALAQQQQQQQLQQQQQQGEMLRQHHERLEQALQQQQQQQQVQPQQPQQPPMPTETSVTAASPVAAAPAAAVEAPPAAALPSAAAPPPATPLPPATAAVPPITIENCNCSGCCEDDDQGREAPFDLDSQSLAASASQGNPKP